MRHNTYVPKPVPAVPVAVIMVDRTNTKYGEPAGSSLYDQCRGAWNNNLDRIKGVGMVVCIDKNTKKILMVYKVQSWQHFDKSLFTTRGPEQFDKIPAYRIMFTGTEVADHPIIGQFYNGPTWGYGFSLVPLNGTPAVMEGDVCKVPEVKGLKQMVSEGPVEKPGVEKKTYSTEAVPVKVAKNAYGW